MMPRGKPVIAISMGDFNGIGPEIILDTVTSPAVRKLCIPVVIGSIDVFAYYASRSGRNVTLREISAIPSSAVPGVIPVFNLMRFRRPVVRPGRVSREAGEYASHAIEIAAGLCLQGIASAMVTAPISKEALQLAGSRFTGHTDMLASLCRSTGATMILTAGSLRVGLVTVHVPLRRVAGLLDRKLVGTRIAVLHAALVRDFGIRSPRIAVLGCNPHAGENGRIGTEDVRIVAPAVVSARRSGIRAEGPFPADGFFGMKREHDFDAILAMYHDQGLIPLKMAGFEKGVNVTAGLPIVRTSPDHGTAFDIAGRGIASPRSMLEAIHTAAAIVSNRRKR